MSKSNSIGGFVTTPLISPNPAPSYGATDTTTSPARGPSTNPGASSAPVSARSSSHATGSTLRASLPPMGQLSAAPFARAQQNAATGPQLAPRDAAVSFLTLSGQNKFGDQNGVSGFAQLMHQGSQAATGL